MTRSLFVTTYRGLCPDCETQIPVTLVKKPDTAPTDHEIWARCRDCTQITQVEHESTKPLGTQRRGEATE